MDRLHNVVSIGRVTVDDLGIRQRRVLYLIFGHSFDLKWAHINGWATAESTLSTSKADKDEVFPRFLEIHHVGGVEIVIWTGSVAQFEKLVAYVRRRLPGKLLPSVSAQKYPGMCRDTSSSEVEPSPGPGG